MGLYIKNVNKPNQYAPQRSVLCYPRVGVEKNTERLKTALKLAALGHG